MHDVPVTGNIKVDVQLAQSIADFLAIFLKMKDSPLDGNQIKEFSAFRELVKAGPATHVPVRDKTHVLADGIVIGKGPRMLLDRHMGVKFLRAMILGDVPHDLKAAFSAALVDAIAKGGPKYNTGINGRICNGVFGYADPFEAKEYLFGKEGTILITRAKTKLSVFPSYFADSPSAFIQADKDGSPSLFEGRATTV